MFAYVNEWHQMIYHPFMFTDFKSGSHIVLLFAHAKFMVSQVHSVKSRFVKLSGLGIHWPALFAISGTSTLFMLVKV